jgi:hypothetical protein
MSTLTRDTVGTPIINLHGSKSSGREHDSDEWEKASIATSARTFDCRNTSNVDRMGLNEFMQNHTSEDDASFNEIAAKVTY